MMEKIATSIMNKRAKGTNGDFALHALSSTNACHSMLPVKTVGFVRISSTLFLNEIGCQASTQRPFSL
jgi:hypothetical protein